jgi:ABC-type Na+ efflux pump permease subunit
MIAFWSIVKRELNSVRRDFTIVISIVIQLFIASFSSALLIGMLSLYDPDSVGVYGNVNLQVAVVGATAGDPLPGLLRDRGMRVSQFPNLSEAQTAFYANKVRAILSAPQERDGVVDMKLYLPRSETASSAVLMMLQDPLKRYENIMRQQRGIEIRYGDMKGKPPTAFEFIYSVILPILMFFPAFVAGSMVIDMLSEEVENNTLQTLLASPISINGIVSAKITAAILLAVAQSAAWLGLLSLNRIAVQNVPWVLLLAALIAGLTTVGAGIVGSIFRDRERSQFVFSLALLVATSITLALDFSPLKVLSRLAIGDAYTTGWDVAIFAVFLAAAILLLSRVTRKLKA